MRSVVEIGASVPAFLGKLWKLVNDTETNHLISWSPGGKTFVIKNQADFARELLPLYYKHNNMASFIRQLNMYGFHKITSVENGGLRYEKDEIEFSHPCFMKGHAYLLEHIKRKIANPKLIVTSNDSGDKLIKPELMNKMLSDVKFMKGKQESLDAKFSAMKQENEALWREVAILRQKHIKQQQIVNNLIQFLCNLVQPGRSANPNGNNVGVKRPYQLMINNAAHNSSTDGSYPGRFKNVKLDKDVLLEDFNDENMEDGPTIHELAHDDIVQNDNISQNLMVPSDYVSILMPSNTNTRPVTVQSQTDPTAQVQYHVTMEDGDDPDLGARLAYPINRINGTMSNEEIPIVTTPSPNRVTPESPSRVTAASPNRVTPSPNRVTPTSLNRGTPTSPNRVTPSPVDNTAMETLTNNSIPILTASSKVKTRNAGKYSVSRPMLSTNNFHSMNPSADLKLPAEIFASDDSVSDAGLPANEDITNVLQDLARESAINEITSTKDKMLGGINIKLEKPESPRHRKSKKRNDDHALNLTLSDIKTELQDDFEWNNMTLATVNTNNNVSKFQPRNDIDDHLDAMQTDLESLRELLRSDSYSLDTNTLMGNPDARLGPQMSLHHHPTLDYLFGADDPFYGLAFNNPPDERPNKATNNAKKQMGEFASSGDDKTQQLFTDDDDVDGNQLISYTGNIPDFEDISIPDLECDNSQDGYLSPVPSGSTLNTPRVEVNSPSYSLKP